MAVYVIGDLHLSQTANKSMDIFPGWENYTQRIQEKWHATVASDDTVVLAGDISWGMDMQEAMADFQLLERLPGKKIILKGNHDYWWSSVTSMHRALANNGVTSVDFLHNNNFVVENIAICGSRGWLFENGAPHDTKIIRREGIRLQASLASVADSSLEKVLFLHYPPVYSDQVMGPFIETMQEHGVTRCYYGHIHASGHRYATEGLHYGIEFNMISADYINFTPQRIAP